MNTNENKQWTVLLIAWVISLVALVGSLYFSEVRGYLPCTLCWYQRILMYPLGIILFMGLLPSFKNSAQKNVVRFSLPLVVIGWVIAGYHLLLQKGVIVAELTPCKTGVSCRASYINWGGFITIPTLSFVAFTLIAFLLLRVYSLRSFDA